VLAWSVFGVYLVRAAWITAVLIRVLGVPAHAALALLRGALPFSLAVAGTLFAVDHGLQVLGILAPLRLASHWRWARCSRSVAGCCACVSWSVPIWRDCSCVTRMRRRGAFLDGSRDMSMRD